MYHAGFFMTLRIIFFIFLSAFSFSQSVSIIVPCHPKHLRYLPEVFRTFEEQTVLPEEIVVAISEADRVKELIETMQSYKCSIPVKYVLCNEKKGPGENRNAACSVASGDLFICHDADDLAHPQRVEIIKKYFQIRPVDILLHCYGRTSEQKKVFSKTSFHNCRYYPVIDFGKTDYLETIHRGNCALRREVFEKVQWGTKYIGEDVEFLQKGMQEGFRLGIINAVLLIYRNENSSFREF